MRHRTAVPIALATVLLVVPTAGAAVKKDRLALRLDIPALPKAEVTLEVDARDEDLLGLAKTLNVQGIPVAEALGDVEHLRILTYKWEVPEQRPVPDVTRFFESAFRKEVTVARADGYPNLEKPSPLLALFLGGVFGGTAAAPAQGGR